MIAATPQVEYLIAQYLRDPMRREAKNVGLIVTAGTDVIARFIGEQGETGEIDLRSTKWTGHPKTYRKWLKFWRQELRRGTTELEDRLTRGNGGNYDIIPGGYVSDT